MDYTVHGILQARTLEWVAIPFSRGSSQPRDWTQVSHIACRLFTSWANEQGCINRGKDFIFYLMFDRKPLKNFKWSKGMIWCTFQMTHYSDCCLWTGLGRRTGNWRLLLETIIRRNWGTFVETILMAWSGRCSGTRRRGRRMTVFLPSSFLDELFVSAPLKYEKNKFDFSLGCRGTQRKLFLLQQWKETRACAIFTFIEPVIQLRLQGN